jgi:hypothetical protein
MKIYEKMLPNPKITSHYGKRTDPVTGKAGAMHYGVDLISSGVKNWNRHMTAIEDGYVQLTRTGQDNAKTGYGNYIWVRYPRINRSCMYAHCAKILLKKGDKVKEGTEVAIMGKTGKATGVHLHLGMTEIGKSAWLNPETYEYTPPTPAPKVTPTVDRDETKNQLKVIASSLRVRKTPTTSGDIVGIAQTNGIYNFFETADANGYTWYKIADDQWIANNGSYLEVYINNEEEKMIEELNKKIETLTKDKEKLQSENKELKTQVESLLLDKASVVFSWIANKTNTYKIKLNEGEILQIKR